MQPITKQHLRQLCDLACELGASNAKTFDASDVVVDERVRLKCQIPMCADYGMNLMCPPNLGITIPEFSQTLSKYKHAMLLQIDSYPSQEMKQLIDNEVDLNQLYKNPEFLKNYNETITSAKKQLHNIINQVESAAFSKGYRFSTGFIGGSCSLCERCVAADDSNEPCRHPFKSRPSMEAMGIDVFKTAINAELPFEIPPKDKTVWTGLILVE